MRAIAYTHSLPASDPAALQDMDLPDPPAPTGRDLLVAVHAISVNPVDAKVRLRDDPRGSPKILGYDAAGVVRAVGPGATLFRPGDAVFYAGDITRPGTNAALHLVDERLVGPKPAALSFAQAAAVPLTAITAWEALFDRLRIPRGTPAREEAVLIIGGAGGVGSIAVQLARQLTGLRVVATASRPETVAWAREMGAHDVLDHAGDLAAQARALGVPFPAIFVTTQTEAHWPAVCEIIAPQGAICLIDDPKTAPDFRMLKLKAASLHWELMFTRSRFRTPDMQAQHALLVEVSRMLDTGTLRTTLGEHFGPITAANLRRAHAAIESGTSRGKIVLEGFPAG
ncbi:zinc-binding alcohol dehydrogenase family protein [Falsiroseomonas selenitidurans]|uniref:Zinc-type alcohol dehydrogenase-like protein n=1 Tax=Falsiroseomonas selenitidurans TaxID=2716335 RepID=A0ABX1E4R3_9PROT|nr:zinc-binding alcohol dehydrogenase family protein [Falsiroseomonas selenitidurans]NKC30803.1 zinc-binding alcohol dehydrogenase family protein [Falsiroseomonas selenitidurans]